MPGFLLHQGAVVMCAHGGQAQPSAVNPRVKVSGLPIPIANALYQVAGCAFPPPPAANGPCVTAIWATMALRVKANGLPVLLLDSQAVCAPTGTPVIITTTQLRVKGM